MKRLIALMLTFLIVFTCALSVSATSINSSAASSSPLSESTSIAVLAAQYLASIRASVGASCTSLGFSVDEFINMSVGTPFVIHSFNESGGVVSGDTYMCPLIYEGQVVGDLKIHYDSATSSYSYALGTAYAEPLNNLIQTSTLKNSASLVFGSIGDKFFATNGSQVVVLFDAPIEDTCIEIEKIEQVCKTAKTNANGSAISANSITQIQVVSSNLASTQQARGSSGLLSVPHVAQNGGICGVAAWAAVLNYRFNTSYTTYTLNNAMSDSGYMNGSSGLPLMTDYRDFANDVYYAGCVFVSSPPSFTTVEAAIDARKPIMGSWYSGSGSNKVYHAILIVGYIENISNYTYYVKNPWYTSNYVISVTSSNNVVWVDGSYTWILNQVVY